MRMLINKLINGEIMASDAEKMLKTMQIIDLEDL